MKWLGSRIAWGILLIIGGILFLLQNLGLVEVGALFWTLLFGFAGISFLSVYLSDRVSWWALLPGIILLALAAQVAVGVLAPDLSEELGGALFLGGISAAFLLVYLVERSNWWALIPGGVLATLAVVSAIDLPGIDTGAIFFIGLGLTFALVALLPNPHGTMKWAWIPAGILLLIGLLILTATGFLINYIWSIALIGLGIFLLARALLQRRQR